MNGDGRTGILVAALILSSALHFCAMSYARPKVMTSVASDAVRSSHRAPMRVTRSAERPEPVKIDSVRDVDALQDAPEAEHVADVPTVAAGPVPDATVEKALPPAAETPPALKPEITAAVLDAKLLGSDRSEETVVRPIEPIGGFKAATAVAAPDPGLAALPAAREFVPTGPAVGGLMPAPEPARIVQPAAADEAEAETKFEPEKEVREKVDEKVVEREKEAVRELLNVQDAAELRRFVNVAVTKASDASGTYFKVMLSPRHELPVVPKDVVVLIDASGSIGRDRIRSVRAAAKDVLRSCMNSGDRFNLVAFRDRYEYAFRTWQDCSQSAFDKADRWLDNVAAHGRTDVFATIRSVLTLPRTPERPLIAMVVTDGDANVGVRETSEILSKFTALNDGLVSVYMYGVKNSANRELIDVLTRGNRGESRIYDGWLKWKAGEGIGAFVEKFREPVLSDLRIVFAAGTRAEAYPRLLRNLYRGDTLTFVGRVPADAKEVAFSIRGLGGKDSYEGFFRMPLAEMAEDATLASEWKAERDIDLKLK